MQEVRAAEGALDEMREMWLAAFDEATTNLQSEKAAGKEKTAPEGGEKFQLIGKRADGIEVYETGAETKALSWKERKRQFMRLMENDYRGRTAKFVRNGHTYYARFASDDLRKNIYGDNKSDDAGRDAKVNVGADGGIFDLVENAQYRNSEPERGKPTRAHKNVSYWDYFVKAVQIDGRVFDLLANVRRKQSGEFVYSLQLNLNDTIEAALPETRPNEGELNGAPTASDVSKPQSDAEVKPKLQTWDSAGNALTEGQKAFFANSETS